MRSLGRLTLLVSLGGCSGATDPGQTVSAPSLGKAPAGTVYTLIGSANGSTASGVNDAGVVVGTIGTGLTDTPRGFVWTPTTSRASTGTLRDIGTLGGAATFARGVNAAGHVVGVTSDGAGIARAYLWTAVGGMKDLGLPAGASDASAWDVNGAGQVAGLAGFPDGSHATVWQTTVTADGSVQVSAIEELGTLPGGGTTIAFAVSESGQAVGWAVPNFGANHPILWTRTSDGWMVEDLGPLPGHFSAVAEDVNSAGMVAGFSIPNSTTDGCRTAVVWTTQAGRKTGIRALQTLGGCGSEAYGINDQGDVVGRSLTRQGEMRATVWSVAPDGSTLGVKDLGAPTTSSTGLAYHVSSRIGGVAQAAGFILAPRNALSTIALWTIR